LTPRKSFSFKKKGSPKRGGSGPGKKGPVKKTEALITPSSTKREKGGGGGGGKQRKGWVCGRTEWGKTTREKKRGAGKKKFEGSKVGQVGTRKTFFRGKVPEKNKQVISFSKN